MFKGVNYYRQMSIGGPVSFLRYPGGKQRYIEAFLKFVPNLKQNNLRLCEPFVGGASIFFALNPRDALLSDLNQELINLYQEIKIRPKKIWKLYREFPNTKLGYYLIRDQNLSRKSNSYKAARTLYLNRTCFKGMWRHNSTGKFNVGYGGEDRRWVIDEDSLFEVSRRLKTAELRSGDFEVIINESRRGDFLFLDPPYAPGKVELKNAHYQFNAFTFEDHKRLAASLKQAHKRGAVWTMTTSSHPKIRSLFGDYNIFTLRQGVGGMPGIRTSSRVGEILVTNWRAK